jgi:hypothetical protein
VVAAHWLSCRQLSTANMLSLLSHSPCLLPAQSYHVVSTGPSMQGACGHALRTTTGTAPGAAWLAPTLKETLVSLTAQSARSLRRASAMRVMVGFSCLHCVCVMASWAPRHVCKHGFVSCLFVGLGRRGPGCNRYCPHGPAPALPMPPCRVQLQSGIPHSGMHVFRLECSCSNPRVHHPCCSWWLHLHDL